MSVRIIKLLALALINAAVYNLVYVFYLHEIFAYADFRYEATSHLYLFWTYLIAALPIVATRKSNSPSAIGGVLIYVLSYVPIQLTLTFMWAEKTAELFSVQILLALSMVALFRSSIPSRIRQVDWDVNKLFSLRLESIAVIIHILTSIGLVLTIIEFHSIMRLVSFANVYDLRSETDSVSASMSTQYLMMWMTYCFGPFYIARGIYQGRKLDWFVGGVIFMVMYAVSGSKIALLTPLFMVGINYIDGGRTGFAIRLMAMVATFSLLILLVIPNEGIARWISSIILMRIFGSNGWVAAVYYEYFSNHALTFYSHIGPINALIDAYPYGSNSLGQEIAQYYFSNDANFNAGFWASDGFAAMGMYGVPVVTAFLAIFMRTFDRLAIHYPARFINLWMVGFWMVLINAPFTTALLSGGGLLIAIFLWVARLFDRRKLSRRLATNSSNNIKTNEFA